jgi:hypothetical protein
MRCAKEVGSSRTQADFGLPLPVQVVVEPAEFAQDYRAAPGILYCVPGITLYCTTREGIYHTPEFDLSRTERSADWETSIEKELAFCEVCHEPFAAKEHLVWIAHKVGDLANSNPTLFLSLYQELGTAEPRPRGDVQPYRSDTLRILCPDCRRKTYLAEEWGY